MEEEVAALIGTALGELFQPHHVAHRLSSSSLEDAGLGSGVADPPIAPRQLLSLFSDSAPALGSRVDFDHSRNLRAWDFDAQSRPPGASHGIERFQAQRSFPPVPGTRYSSGIVPGPTARRPVAVSLVGRHLRQGSGKRSHRLGGRYSGAGRQRLGPTRGAGTPTRLQQSGNVPYRIPEEAFEPWASRRAIGNLLSPSMTGGCHSARDVHFVATLPSALLASFPGSRPEERATIGSKVRTVFSFRQRAVVHQ